MRRKEIVNVSSVWEEHTFVFNQRCSCGGSYSCGKWELHPENGSMLEVAYVKCDLCGNQTEFWFDLTHVFNQHDTKKDDFKKAWPPPTEGPYIVQVRDYKKRAEVIVSKLESRELSSEEAENYRKELLDECHPKIAGKYQVFGFRKGSMSITYLCVDKDWSPDLSRPYFVVCKTLDTSPSVVSLDALEKEVRIWLEIGKHRNIVELFDLIAVTPTRLVLVMEAILPGPLGRTTLREWLIADAIELPLAIRFFRNICCAIAYCRHQIQDFVHGDLKPENLLVDVGYLLKVTDFGLSRACDFTGLPLGSSLGTPLYLAPECWKGNDATEKSDVYSAGMIMYEMLNRRHPFGSAKGKEDLEWLHIDKKIEPIINPMIPKSISSLVMRCLSKDPADRPNFVDLVREIGVCDFPYSDLEIEKSAVDFNNKGKALADLGEHAEAIDCYIQGISLEPTNTIGWSNLAVSFSKIGRKDQAERVYKFIIDQGNVPAQVYANYAAHILRSGDKTRIEEAISYCDIALKLDPENIIALINKAALLNSIERYSEAAKVSEKAKSIDPSNPHIFVELGTAYMKMRRRSKALKCAKKALQLDSRFEPAKILKKLIKNI